jgi:hypothetical protein
MTYIKGGHELHFGGEALRVRNPMAVYYLQNGVFSFTDSLSGDNVADFILGRVSQFTQGGGVYVNTSGIKWSAFVQDNWRVNPRLTINGGLRWDPYWPYQDSEGRFPCFVPGLESRRYPNAPLGLLYGGYDTPACPPGVTWSNLSNFAPRVGFAYRMTKDGKTSLRGGVGYYYAPPATVTIQDPVGAPFAPVVTLSSVSFQDPYGSAGVPNPFPAEFGPKVPGPDASFPSDLALYYFDRNFRLPEVVLWNLTLERQIGASWVFRAAYVGNKGTYLYGTGDEENGALPVNPAIYIPGESTIANTQQRRIYSAYSGIYEYTSGVDSNYNALQLSVEKHLTQGFSLLANYTWSKQLNDFAPVGAPSTTDPFNRHFDYGLSDDDLSSSFKFSGVYQLPHTSMGGVAKKLLNGWQLNYILTWQGGFPFTMFSGLDNSFSGTGADRADFFGTDLHAAQISSGRSHGQQINEWFDTSLFGANAVGTFGDTGKNILRGPKLFNTDLGLFKDTKIGDRMTLQFRAEFFNAFNNVNFGMPDHTFTDTAFGQITSASDPRILQFALKFAF